MAAVIRGDVKILAKSVVDVVFTNASQRPSKMQFGRLLSDMP